MMNNDENWWEKQRSVSEKIAEWRKEMRCATGLGESGSISSSAQQWVENPSFSAVPARICLGQSMHLHMLMTRDDTHRKQGCVRVRGCRL